MKKLFVILLTLALMLTLIGNVTSYQLYFDDTTGVRPSTSVEYHMQPTYLITVPSGIYFTGATSEVHDWVNATNLVLEAGKIVTVSVTSEHNGQMFAHIGNSVVGSGLDYKLYTRDHSLGHSFNDDVEVLLSKEHPATILSYTIPSEEVGVIEKRIELKFKLEEISDNRNLLSGNYKDALTFTASYSGTSV